MADVLTFLEGELLTCLCELLADESRPVCACHKFGGASPPVADRCQKNAAGANGQAWVRRADQSLETGDPTFGGQLCGGAWSAAVELGIYRCISAIPDVDGHAPPTEAYDADADLLSADRLTLARVLCCDVLTGQAVLPFEASVTVTDVNIAPTGPSGSCAGSILTVRLRSVVEARDEVPDQVFVSGPAGGS